MIPNTRLDLSFHKGTLSEFNLRVSGKRWTILIIFYCNLGLQLTSSKCLDIMLSCVNYGYKINGFRLQLVNRHNSSKKQPMALTDDMLNELNKNHMGGLDNYGADDLYNMDDVWNEKPVKKVIELTTLR